MSARSVPIIKIKKKLIHNLIRPGIKSRLFQLMTFVDTHPSVTAATVPPLGVLIPTMTTPANVQTTMSMMGLMDV